MAIVINVSLFWMAALSLYLCTLIIIIMYTLIVYTLIRCYICQEQARALLFSSCRYVIRWNILDVYIFITLIRKYVVIWTDLNIYYTIWKNLWCFILFLEIIYNSSSKLWAEVVRKKGSLLIFKCHEHSHFSHPQFCHTVRGFSFSRPITVAMC